MKPKKIHKGVEIMSLSAVGGHGRVNLRAPIAVDEIASAAELVEKLKASGQASMYFDFAKNQSKSDNFNFESIEDVLPKDGDYISVPFRAISKRFIPGHCLDFTRDTVLEDSVEKLYGATVYPNHDLFDINNALGVVADASWDADDRAKKGAPGINAIYKIDALMNPRISRLLLMKPPAIHSTSMTVLFDFEFSHPQLVEEGRFWNLLGEEVEGEIVRMIVTEIHEYWEASLVFQGADRTAKNIDDDEKDLAGMSADEAAAEPPSLNEEKTMKLTSEQKTKLGIEFDGDDVPETEIFKAGESLADKVAELTESTDAKTVAELLKQADVGKALLDEKRAEVKRLATIAECGAEDKELPKVIADDIEAAAVERLQALGTFYTDKVATLFPKGGRSSEESTDESTVVSNQAVAEDDPTGGLL